MFCRVCRRTSAIPDLRRFSLRVFAKQSSPCNDWALDRRRLTFSHVFDHCDRTIRSSSTDVQVDPKPFTRSCRTEKFLVVLRLAPPPAIDALLAATITSDQILALRAFRDGSV